MRNKYLRLISFVAVLFAAGTLCAQTTIKIVKAAGTGKESVSLDELRSVGASADLFKQVLKQDLDRSGWFTVASGSYISIRVAGTASGQGNMLTTNIRVQWPAGSFIWAESTQTPRDVRWQAHRLSDRIVKSIKGVDGIASTRIAFVGKTGLRGGGIYLCDYDGANAVQLTNEQISPLSPYFDPTGQFIFYTSFDKGFPCVFRVPAAGGRRSPYANFTGLNTGGAVSPDGKYIAIILSHVGNPELFVLNLGDRKVYRQTKTPRASEASPCWSPSGSQIAYVTDVTGTPQVYVVDSNTHASKRISFRGSQNVAPSWGPDGRIAYCSKQSGYQIVVYDPKTGSEEVITQGTDYEDPSWAPDGRHIICSRKDGPSSYSLYILDTEDKSSVRLSLPSGNWHAPDWSRSVQ